MQGLWVQSRVRVPRSGIPCGQNQSIKQKKYRNKFNEVFKNGPHFLKNLLKRLQRKKKYWLQHSWELMCTRNLNTFDKWSNFRSWNLKLPLKWILFLFWMEIWSCLWNEFCFCFGWKACCRSRRIPHFQTEDLLSLFWWLVMVTGTGSWIWGSGWCP